jgi:hypothetical protein
MYHPPEFSSRQSSPICVPLFRSHSRSEASNEHVMICRPLGKCKTWHTCPVWPRIVWRGVIAGVLLVEEDMVRAQSLNYVLVSPDVYFFSFDGSEPHKLRRQCTYRIQNSLLQDRDWTQVLRNSTMRERCLWYPNLLVSKSSALSVRNAYSITHGRFRRVQCRAPEINGCLVGG